MLTMLVYKDRHCLPSHSIPSQKVHVHTHMNVCITLRRRIEIFRTSSSSGSLGIVQACLNDELHSRGQLGLRCVSDVPFQLQARSHAWMIVAPAQQRACTTRQPVPHVVSEIRNCGTESARSLSLVDRFDHK
jgi:hypothetical protein